MGITVVVHLGVYGTALGKLEPTNGKPSYRSIFLAGCIGGAGIHIVSTSIFLNMTKNYHGNFFMIDPKFSA